MAWPELDREWARLIDSQRSCNCCASSCTPPLACSGAKPLFGRFKVWQNGVFFIFEAPNWDDTFNKDKGYLTYDRETDPTGRFTRLLMVEQLGLDPDFFQVKNSVLCLPAAISGKFPVNSEQRERCARRIEEQIRVLDPAVVVPVGGKALGALCSIECHPYREILTVAARPRRWLG